MMMAGSVGKIQYRTVRLRSYAAAAAAAALARRLPAHWVLPSIAMSVLLRRLVTKAFGERGREPCRGKCSALLSGSAST